MINLSSVESSAFAGHVFNIIESIQKAKLADNNDDKNKPPPLELEVRLGKLTEKGFEPGVKEEYFASMLKYLRGKYQHDKKSTIDVLFKEDNVRVTYNVQTKQCETAIIKQRVIAPYDYEVKKGDIVHKALRMGCAYEIEQVLNKEMEEIALGEIKKQLDFVTNSSSASMNHGGGNELPPSVENGYPLRLKWNASEKSFKQEDTGLLWTILDPKPVKLWGVETEVAFTSAMITFDSKSRLVISNLPGKNTVTNRYCSAFEKILNVSFADVEVVRENKLVVPVRRIYDGDNIQLIREKERTSFTFEHQVVLELTKTTTITNAGVAPALAYEVEMERVFDEKPESDTQDWVVRVATSFVRGVFKHLYGVKEEPGAPPLYDEQHLNLIRKENHHPITLSPSKNNIKKRQKLEPPTSNSSVLTAVQSATAHYGDLDRSDKDARKTSVIFHMRNLNNFVKSVLIKAGFPAVGYCSEISILDLACGKGADFGKFVATCSEMKKFVLKSYVGIDIALGSLHDAEKRITPRINEKTTSFKLIEADLGSVSFVPGAVSSAVVVNAYVSTSPAKKFEKIPLPKALHDGEKFNLISMQFAFHYMFRTRASAHSFFQTLSSRCEEGGCFVATTVNPDKVLSLLLQSRSNAIQIRDEENGGAVVCSLSFSPPVLDKLLRFREMKTCGYGLEYEFTLSDGDSKAVSAPEWLIPSLLLESLVAKYGFEVEKRQPLTGFALSMVKDNEALWKKMNVPNLKGVLRKYEWLIASLYQVIIIRKTRTYSVDELLEIPFEEEIADMQLCYNFLGKNPAHQEQWQNMTDEEKNAQAEKLLREYYNNDD